MKHRQAKKIMRKANELTISIANIPNRSRVDVDKINLLAKKARRGYAKLNKRNLHLR
jgi:hypothetical protein